MTNTLALAARLRAMPDDALVAALATRTYRRTGITDFFDLADALLDHDSVQRVLSGLDRPTLAVLVALGRASGTVASAGSAPSVQDANTIAAALAGSPAAPQFGRGGAEAALERLSAALLVHPEADGFAVYEAVSDQLATWPSLGLPSLEAIVSTPAPPALASVPDTEHRFTDRLAAERAFEAVAAVSELLAELVREGARELQKGGLALPATKRIASALAIDVSVVPTVVSVAARAGLIAQEDAVWLPTEEATAWLHSATIDRWRALAAAWQTALPEDLRGILSARSRAAWGESLSEYVAWLYPAGQESAQRRVVAYTRDADWLGITANHAPSTGGTALVERGPDAAAQAIGAHFPAEVDKVYLQHDLTVVSPDRSNPRSTRGCAASRT
ncbi:hypothetical protein [Leifsonia poae]|uniref:hypothetical protein n=1 Tax=Leifsonia poae TaxID=110933 RepID=UPI003D6797F7